MVCIVVGEPVFTVGDQTLLFLKRIHDDSATGPDNIAPLAYYRVCGTQGKGSYDEGVVRGIYPESVFEARYHEVRKDYSINVSTIEDAILAIKKD